MRASGWGIAIAGGGAVLIGGALQAEDEVPNARFNSTDGKHRLEIDMQSFHMESVPRDHG